MALELSSLLSRLAHRVPWETWMLTENEFKILE